MFLFKDLNTSDDSLRPGIECPECLGSSNVVDTRYSKSSVDRIRRCRDHECDQAFKTVETITDKEDANIVLSYNNCFTGSTVVATRNYGKFIVRKRILKVGPIKLSFDTTEKVVKE